MLLFFIIIMDYDHPLPFKAVPFFFLQFLELARSANAFYSFYFRLEGNTTVPQVIGWVPTMTEMRVLCLALFLLSLVYDVLSLTRKYIQ